MCSQVEMIGVAVFREERLSLEKKEVNKERKKEKGKERKKVRGKHINK